MKIEAGMVFKVEFPFTKSSYQDLDEEGGVVELETWIPGTRTEAITPEDIGLFADGVGFMLLKVISKHKPGKYPERIFYTRKFVDPDGKFFGKGKLYIAVISKFRRIANSYYCDYVLEKPSEEGLGDRKL